MSDALIADAFDPVKEELFLQRVLFHSYMVTRFGSVKDAETDIKERISLGAWTAARGAIEFLRISGRINSDFTLIRNRSGEGAFFEVGKLLEEQIGFSKEGDKRKLDNVKIFSLEKKHKHLDVEKYYLSSFTEHGHSPVVILRDEIQTASKFVVENLVWLLNGKKETGQISIEWKRDTLIQHSIMAVISSSKWRVLFASVVKSQANEAAINEAKNFADSFNAVALCYAPAFHQKAIDLTEKITKIPLLDILGYLKLISLLNEADAKSMSLIVERFPEVLHQKGLLHVKSGWNNAINKSKQ